MTLSTAWSTFTSAGSSTAHTPTLPSGRAGRRVLLFFSTAAPQTTTLTITGSWTNVISSSNGNGRMGLYYRDCDGTSADNITLNLTVAATMKVAFAVLSGEGTDFAPASQTPGGNFTGSNPDPPAITPSWGTREQIVFTLLNTNVVTTTVTTWPSGYSTGANMPGTGTFNGLFVGYKVMAVGASENPGTYTMSASVSTVLVWTAAAVGAIPPVTVTPGSLFTNGQTFYAPTVKQALKVKPSLHTNGQTFFGPKRVQRVFASLHTNAQGFFAPTVTRGATVSAPRFDNAQVFYGPKIAAAVAVGQYINDQIFFTLSVRGAGQVTAPYFVNAQTFFAPSLKASRVILAPRHDNTQQFYGAALQGVAGHPFHINQQTFYGHTVVQGVVAANIRPPFHVNSQIFFGPSVVQAGVPIPPSPGRTVGAIGPGWWTDSLKDPPGLEKPKKEEEIVWKLPAYADIPNAAPPWQPMVVRADEARANALRRKRMGEFFKHQAGVHKARRDVEDMIITSVIVAILKEDA